MNQQKSPEILVVGAGPVGLALASELARHGVVPRIIDKNDMPLPFCRAIGVTPRTLEVFEDMGIAREIIDAGLWMTGLTIVTDGSPPRQIIPDLSDLPYSQLGVPQYTTEAVLATHLGRLGVQVEHGTALTGLAPDDGGAAVTLEGPGGTEEARFRFVIGCDGAHSAVRRALAIPFEGEAFPMEFMLGDVRIDWDLPRGMAMRASKLVENDAPDLFVAIPLPERNRYRVSMQAPKRLSDAAKGTGTGHGIQADRPGATLADLQEVADRLLPGQAPLSDMRWSSIFRISMRLAARYRSGNVFIAGDACHIHPPTGGQGMNTGIQDAYNLAWKLALVVRGKAADSLLESYETERRPVAADVVARTTEQSIHFGRDKAPPHRLQDTQLLVSYRDGPLASGSTTSEIGPGDRVPDIHGLRRLGFGFPLRMFDLLKGPRFVLLLSLPKGGNTRAAEACAARLNALWPDLVRVIAIADPELQSDEPPGVELIRDGAGAFAKIFGGEDNTAWLVRPDNYVGLVLPDWSEQAIIAYLKDTICLVGKERA